MPRLLIRQEKAEVIGGKKRIIRKHHTYYIGDESKDFQTEEGIVNSKDLKKTGLVKTSQNKELLNLPARFIDIWKHLIRGPQIPLLKDIGRVIAETGINKDSVIIDAGGGSGGVACFFAHFAKQVSTYEIREDHIEIIKENKKKLDLNNIIIHKENVFEGIKEKEVDLVFYDLPTPWEGIEQAKLALKVGGFLVGYLPTIPQMSQFVNVLKEDDSFIITKKIELMERPWKVDDLAVRPVSKGIQHSGFLIFARKLKS